MKALDHQETKNDSNISDEEKLYKDLLIKEIKNKVKNKIDDNSLSVVKTIKFLLAQDDLPRKHVEKKKTDIEAIEELD
jgi:hypothetical protein